MIPAEAHDDRTTSERTNQSSANQSGELSLALAGRQFWSRPRQVDTNKKREVRSAAATELKLEVSFFRDVRIFLSTTCVRASCQMYPTLPTTQFDHLL